MKARRILVVTGTRAEYGLLRPVLRAIRARKSLKLLIAASGMHFLPQFGRTVKEILADGFRPDCRVPMAASGTTPEATAAAVGEGVRRFAHAFARLRPDVVLVLGDRTEALAAAVAAAYMNIFIAHVHGGDKSQAGVDEAVRHAITKLAHLHFAATRRSAERILRMGERRRHVFRVGAPGIDDIVGTPLPSRKDLLRRRGLDFPGGRYALLVQHPVTTQYAEVRSQIRETLAALRRTGLPVVAVYPNNDAGGRIIIRELLAFARRGACALFRSLPRPEYLAFLKHAAFLVGNSSSGVIEAASFRVPVINVGIRQAGRERSSNVADVPPRAAAIAAAAKRVLGGGFARRLSACRNVYGDGRASERISRILATVHLNHGVLQKQISY